MARIPYADPEQFDEATARVIGQLAPLNIFRMMANAPGLLRPFVGLGGAFLFDGKLDPVTRECAILRVGYLSNARYETAQHEKKDETSAWTPLCLKRSRRDRPRPVFQNSKD